MSNIGLNSNIYHSTRAYLDLLNNYLIDVQEQIKRPLAEQLLFGDLAKGGHVRIMLDDNGDLEMVSTPATRSLEHIPDPA